MPDTTAWPPPSSRSRTRSGRSATSTAPDSPLGSAMRKRPIAVATAIGRLRMAEPNGLSGAVDVALRPERVRLRLDGGGHAVVSGITYFGHDQLVEVVFDDGRRVRSRMGPARAFEPGDRVSVAVSGDVIAFGASGS